LELQKGGKEMKVNTESEKSKSQTMNNRYSQVQGRKAIPKKDMNKRRNKLNKIYQNESI